MRIFLRLLRYFKPYWKTLLLGLVCMLLSTPASLFHPLVWMFIVDEVIKEQQAELLLPAVLVMLAVHVFGMALGVLRSNLLGKVGERFVQDLRNETYEKLQNQSIGYFHENRTGDLQARVMNDIDALQNVALQGTDSILANLLSFTFVAGTLIWLHPVLGTVTILPVLLVFVVIFFFNRHVKKLYRAARERLGDVGARLTENLNGMTVIKAYAKEPEERERFYHETDEYRKVQYKAINARSVFFPSMMTLGFLSNVISIGLGGYFVLQGTFTLGGLVAYRGYWWQLFAPVQQLGQINDMIQRAAAAANRVFQILDEPVVVRDREGAMDLETVAGQVDFEEVVFGYAKTPVLNGVTLRVAPGQRIALVGSSGAGKSTFLNLLMRFWDPQEGRVLIDGHDLRDLTQRSLRKHIGMVLQETFLFTGSVLENVRYAKPDATMEQVVAAAEAANALNFIESLADGWETQIGERGVKLSGGQRQRLAITRAFLSDPEILILDEATSAVEPESELIIQQALERLMQHRTAFIVSHRLSMVRSADVIVVLDQGRILEKGTHDELLTHGGLYASMYQMQMGHLAGELV